MTGSSHVPVNDIVPVLMNNLPLKSDETEYENVFKALCKLYAAGMVLNLVMFLIVLLKILVQKKLIIWLFFLKQ